MPVRFGEIAFFQRLAQFRTVSRFIKQPFVIFSDVGGIVNVKCTWIFVGSIVGQQFRYHFSGVTIPVVGIQPPFLIGDEYDSLSAIRQASSPVTASDRLNNGFQRG